MTNSEKIIDRIKEENIQPIPKWYFITKHFSTWFIFILSVVIGAAAFSVILYSIQQTEFNLVSQLNQSKFALILGLLPFLWIIALIIFLIVAMVSIQHSRKGYKFNLSKLIGFSAAFSILIGTLFFVGGGARWLDHTFAANVDIYESIDDKKKKIWMNPSDGYLSGAIEELLGDTIRMLDFDGKRWSLMISDAWIAPPVFLEVGEQIKVIGNISGEDVFTVDEMRPWGGRGFRHQSQTDQ